MRLAASVFTLSWTHSAERTQWEELWSVSAVGLHIIESRIKGSGAGMEPTPNGVLKDGWWVYRPQLPAQKRLLLAASGKTASGWTICASGRCQNLGEAEEGPLTLEPCPPH
jgi:hypothetical protein